jgi:toxin HigB-1
MNVPGFGFHPLKGNRAGTYSVWINGNWRLTFRWDEGATDVALEDYH